MGMVSADVSYAGIYKPDKSSPLYTPFLFESHHDLPPTYLQACELDPFRDGGLIYGRSLREVGVQTRVSNHSGLPHAFWAAFPDMPPTKRWIEDTVAGMSWLLKDDQQPGMDSRL